MKKYIVEVYEDRTEWRNEAGELHREDGPAIELASGYKEWWVNGALHREDAPAIEVNDGYKARYLNGQLHREDGPAVEWSDGSKEWWVNGARHRTDGPAVERANNHKAWYLNGEKLTEAEFNNRGRKLIATINVYSDGTVERVEQ
jgi:hypothetical protein